MLFRAFIANLTAIFITSAALAQSPQTSIGVSTEWEMLPPKQFACLEQTLRQEGKADVGTLVTRGMRPSHPQLKVYIDRCNEQRAAGASAQPSESRTDAFVSWFAAEIISKPTFSAAFGQCKSIIARYQDGILDQLKSRATKIESRSRQQEALSTIDNLARGRTGVANAACIKQFVSALRIAGSQTGYYADELSVLNGKLTNSSFDLKKLASAKVEDLTEEGVARLIALTALANLTENDVRNEISSISFAGGGYLTCLVTNDWISWFNSEPFCHGPVLESSLIQSANSLKLP